MQILSTKLTFPPLRPRLVERARLTRLLNQGMACGFVLVSAPAGYGKSTLLSAWLSQLKGEAAWLSLDERDNNPSRFLSALVTALRELDPAVDGTFQSIPDFNAQPDLETYLAPLINQLAHLTQPCCLVLDDYHVIQDPVIHQLIGFVVEHRPAPLRLVIATRLDPPLPLSRLRARSAMLELRQADLQFTQQETDEFLKHTMGLQVLPEDVARVNARTEGWIAGLQMVALSMQNSEDITSFIAGLTGNHRHIFDYLLEEVLERQSPEIRRFLLYTSILDQLTSSLCDALLKEDENTVPARPSASILKELEQRNLFILPLDQERRWYRYHPLLSDLLRLVLEQTHPGQSDNLHRRACRWYEAQGMLPEALQHAISSGDMQLVAQIISANVLVLVETDEIKPTLEKIDSLPADEMIALPWLGIARAWALGTGQIQKSLQVLEAVERSQEHALDTLERQRLKGHIAAARAFVLGAQGNRSDAIIHAREAEALLPSDETAVRAMNLTIWGDLLVANGDDRQALPIVEKALALARQSQKVHIIMVANTSLATAHLFAGRLFELQRVCREALEMAEDYQRRFQHPLSATAEIYALFARLHMEWGENEKAIQYAQKGLWLSERWGRVNSEVICLNYLGRALMLDNQPEQARPVLERVELVSQRISPQNWKFTALYNLESMLDCETNLTYDIDRQRQRIEESGTFFPALVAARLQLRDHQPDAALVALEQALFKLCGQPSFDTIRIDALRALAFQDKGDEPQALAWLQQALAAGESENRLATFVREGADMERLLRLALAKSICPAFVQRLLAAFEARREPQPKPMPTTEDLLEPLSGRELEVLKLLAQGCSDKKIAESLSIARETVHKHLKNIYEKLDVHNRTEASRRAGELGFL